MKNILNYYYHMIIENDIDNEGYFLYQNHLFCLCHYQRNIDESDLLFSLNQEMIQHDFKVNQIILNVNHQVLTLYEKHYYVLLLIKYNNIKCYIPTIIINNPKYDKLKRNNWDYLWSMKIDYVEYQLKHIFNKYPIIFESIYYYIGLSENAIKYFKMIKKDGINLYISHRRIKKNSFDNPIEIIIDYKVRDIAEYLKYCFYHETMNISNIKDYIENLSLNNIDYLLLYIRMLYPSFYFDLYDQIINNKKNENDITIITNKVDEYEKLLQEIFLIISKKVNLLGIDWINNKN